jgi:phosphohistidine phosphatase SixA
MEMFYSPQIFAIRHGSDGNAKGYDRDLTDYGRCQAYFAAQKLEHLRLGLSNFYTSPRKRAKTTTEIITSMPNLEIINKIVTLDLLDSQHNPNDSYKTKMENIHYAVKTLMEVQTDNIPILVTHEEVIKSLISHLCITNTIKIPKIRHGQIIQFTRNSDGKDYFSYDFL